MNFTADGNQSVPFISDTKGCHQVGLQNAVGQQLSITELIFKSETVLHCSGSVVICHPPKNSLSDVQLHEQQIGHNWTNQRSN